MRMENKKEFALAFILGYFVAVSPLHFSNKYHIIMGLLHGIIGILLSFFFYWLGGRKDVY